jgi:hypothetical protein
LTLASGLRVTFIPLRVVAHPMHRLTVSMYVRRVPSVLSVAPPRLEVDGVEFGVHQQLADGLGPVDVVAALPAICFRPPAHRLLTEVPRCNCRK